MMLILLGVLELSDASELKLHLLGGAFLLGRVMHGICMGFMRSNMPSTGRWNCSNPVSVGGSSYRFNCGVSSVSTLTLAPAGRIPLVLATRSQAFSVMRHLK